VQLRSEQFQSSLENTDGNFVGKNGMSSFFLLCFNFFSHCYSLGKYRGNISVGKIRRQFTNENIHLVFLFVFIDFLVVAILYIISN
jgi:hypothetical protein